MAEKPGIDALDQVAEQLGLPIVEQDQAGEITMNSAAGSLHGGGPAKDFAQALARMAGINAEDPVLLSSIESARRDGKSVSQPPTAAGLPGAYSIAIHATQERMRALLLPTSLSLPLATQQRATALDAAAGALHEVANALTAIVGWADVKDSAHPVSERLDWIKLSAQSAWDAARDVLHGVRDDDAATELNVTNVARHVVRLIEPMRQERLIHLYVNIAEDAHVRGARTAVWSILWNLTKNAMEAVDQGGRVALRVVCDEKRVTLEVSDDGPGLDKGAESLVLAPYFTTKAQGTGLGLALVQRAVQDMSGTLELLANEPRGLVVRVTLDRVHVAAVEVETRARVNSGMQEKDPLRDALVLVVEDDHALRELIDTTLRLRGAQVTAVASAAELAQITETFALALVDLTLPDATGDDVIVELRRSARATKCILMSGRESDRVRTAEASPDAAMRKPFVIDDLLDLCRAVMRDRATPIDMQRRGA